MIIRKSLIASRLSLALGLVCFPTWGWSQANTPSQDEIWRKANEAVAQFPRGHIDVLKWEQGNAAPNAQSDAAQKPAGDLLTINSSEEAIRYAWKVHLDLQSTIARAGPETVAHIVAGRWDRVDPSLVKRVEDMDELLEVAAQARKDFANSVAAQTLVQQAKELLLAAESARELGDRMVSVGNWSKLQQAPMQMAELAAQMNLQKAQLAAVQAQGRLLKTLGKWGLHQAVEVPGTQRSLPEKIDTAQDVQSKLQAMQARLSGAERFASRDRVSQAYAAYQGAYANAKLAQAAYSLNQWVMDETVLHYNGMLKSTWDVLAQAQSQLQAASTAVNAQRDFELAQIDLDWVLLGGAPLAFVTLGGAENAPSAAGH